MTEVWWNDLDCACRWWMINEAVMGFDLRETMWSSPVVDGVVGAKEWSLFGVENRHGALGPVTEWDSAEVVAQGSVRFDGCMNVDYGDGHHFCGADDALKQALAMQRVYKLADERFKTNGSWPSLFPDTAIAVALDCLEAVVARCAECGTVKPCACEEGS